LLDALVGRSNFIKNVRPNACQNVSIGNSKIMGISQFHNSITGNEISNDTPRDIINAISAKNTISNISIIPFLIALTLMDIGRLDITILA
jgi:hypothetical protein